MMTEPLKSQEKKALSKSVKMLGRCRRDIGLAAFATEQANLQNASQNLRSLLTVLGVRQDTFERWLKKGK